jgi:hypothetical protein
MRLSFLSLALVASSIDFARADFVLIDTANGYGWNRPTASGTNATFQAWETFGSIGGPNAPQTVFGVGSGDPSVISSGLPNANLGFGGPAGNTWTTINSGGTPNAFDSSSATSNAFLTSGGNIYSPSGQVTPRLEIPNNLDGLTGTQLGGTTTIVLQVRTQGSLPSLPSFSLLDPFTNLSFTPTATSVLASAAGGGFGGTVQDLLVRFDAPGNADLYRLDFSPVSSSLSFDRAAVDTFYSPAAVPEPSSALLLAASALVLRRRRRK